MKKSFLSLVFLLGMVLVFSYPCFSETNPASSSSTSSNEFNDQPSAGTRAGSLAANGLTMRVSELSSRITELERDLRYQSDRIRQLERTVDDLRRNH